MTGVGFLILFGLSCGLFSCEGSNATLKWTSVCDSSKTAVGSWNFSRRGSVYSPCNKSMITYLPGSNAILNWTPVCGLSKAASGSWYFARRGNGSEGKEIAVKLPQRNVTICNSSLPRDRVMIKLPATLVLKNVDERFNGTYWFVVQAHPGCSGNARIDVFIAVTPNVTINCFNSTTLNEGENVACVCRGKGGNPPANVTWYDKDGTQIGGTGKEERTLTRRNVDGKDNGTYKCVAQSHINATNEKSIEIIVNRQEQSSTTKPTSTSISTSKNKIQMMMVVWVLAQLLE